MYIYRCHLDDGQKWLVMPTPLWRGSSGLNDTGIVCETLQPWPRWHLPYKLFPLHSYENSNCWRKAIHLLSLSVNSFYPPFPLLPPLISLLPGGHGGEALVYVSGIAHGGGATNYRDRNGLSASTPPENVYRPSRRRSGSHPLGTGLIISILFLYFYLLVAAVGKPFGWKWVRGLGIGWAGWKLSVGVDEIPFLVNYFLLFVWHSSFFFFPLNSTGWKMI